jgi:[protein-PII] uridylyltransferase
MPERLTDSFLAGKQELIEKYIAGQENNFQDKHAQLIDDYFKAGLNTSNIAQELNTSKNPFSVIALGGYGRREQSMCSDIDLLILFKNEVPPQAADLVQELIYPLWDLRLEVGHATRSIKECLKLALEDLQVLTSVFDARVLWGEVDLFQHFRNKLQKKISRSKSRRYITELVSNSRERHEQFGDASHLLEPNLKDGQGGLRDYHNIRWISQLTYGLNGGPDRKFESIFPPGEYQSLQHALEFIWDVRNRLHHTTGRKNDRLYFEYQNGLADEMKLKKKTGRHPVEVFLGKFHKQTEIIKDAQQMFLNEFTGTNRNYFNIIGRFMNNKSSVFGLEVINNTIGFDSPAEVESTPTLLLEIFKESLRLKKTISTDSKRLIQQNMNRMDDRFRNIPTVAKIMGYLLENNTPENNVLEEMLTTGVLTQLIPEFKSIQNRIQYNEYHIYPVAKHSLHTVAAVKQFETIASSDADHLYRDLYEELEDKKSLLYWAALLHDIGKGETTTNHAAKGAVLARNILRRFGASTEDIDTVSFLIAEHLHLTKIATRRDLNDEETALACARKIRDPKLLKMLFLLTVADGMSTGPKAWDSWTESLIRDLFFKTLNVLNRGELASKEAIEESKKKKGKLITQTDGTNSTGELEPLLEMMSSRYLLQLSVEEIKHHIELYRRLGSDPFIWEVKNDDASDTRLVTICAKDRPGLFSAISGIFTLNGLDVLDAQIFTWKNGIALDIFRVAPPLDKLYEYRTWDRARGNLNNVLTGDLDLTESLQKSGSQKLSKILPCGNQSSKVRVDNNGSSFFTIIEVFSYDFPGLLHAVTDLLYRNGIDIHIAKIATKIDQVIDIFYVRNIDGEKVTDPDQVEKIKKDLSSVLYSNDEVLIDEGEPHSVETYFPNRH